MGLLQIFACLWGLQSDLTQKQHIGNFYKSPNAL